MADLRPHTIVALVKDRPGVLGRIVTRCGERDFNISTLAVGSCEQPGLSRMTFVVDASTDATALVYELGKFEEVVELQDISAREFVSRELALVKVRSTKQSRAQVLEIVGIFDANVVDVTQDTLIVEVTGHERKIDSMVRLLKDFDVVELVRTGRVSMVN